MAIHANKSWIAAAKRYRGLAMTESLSNFFFNSMAVAVAGGGKVRQKPSGNIASALSILNFRVGAQITRD